MRVGSSQVAHLLPSMARTTRAIEKALARLSSGSRLASPREDIAATSMATTLDAQTRGIGVGLRNINAAQSLLMTADSAINSQLDLVARMREIAVQASNGTLNSNDRQNLDKELQQLLAEFQRVTLSTTFNGTPLLDGSLNDLNVMIGNNSVDKIEFDMPSTSSEEVFEKTIGTGSFNSRTTVIQGLGEPGNLELSDFNHDGFLDFFSVGTAGAEISYGLGSGDGTFHSIRTQILIGQNVAEGTGLTLGDFDADGNMDAIAGTDSGDVNWLRGLGDGQFASPAIVVSSSTFQTAFQSGDFNEDGNLDFVGSDGVGSVVINLGRGDGTFEPLTTTSSVSHFNRISVTDLNNDGHLDIVGRVYSGPLRYLLGTGNGTFSTSITIGPNQTFSGDVKTADIDGDGDMDIATTNGGGTALNIYFNQGDGAFSQAVTLSQPSAPLALEIIDLNRDGLMDLLSVDSASGLAYSFMNQGGGTFGSRVTSTISPNAATIYDIEAGDLNGDGVPDIVAPDVFGYIFSALQQTTEQTALSDVRVTTVAKAQALLEILDNATSTLITSRSNMSAIHSRLNFTASSQLLLSESLAEAKSRAVDVDIAEETAELVRLQILQQAQVAVAAQSNLQLQTVLGLLRL